MTWLSNYKVTENMCNAVFKQKEFSTFSIFHPILFWYLTWGQHSGSCSTVSLA